MILEIERNYIFKFCKKKFWKMKDICLMFLEWYVFMFFDYMVKWLNRESF